jgi:cell division protein FtsW (lipid II flippase)
VKSSNFKRRLRSVLLFAVGLCFAVSIPWYRTGGEESRIWLGLPDWVSVALICYVAVAVLNSVAWLLTEIPEGVDERGESE